MSKNSKNTTKEIHELICDMIIKNKIAPGEKVNQMALANQLNVSRTPITKALHILESEGYLEYRPQYGFVVHQMTIKEVLELFELREAIECIVIKDVVKTITDKQIEELESIFDSKDIDGVAYREADMKFHNKLLEICNNDLAKKVNTMFQVFRRIFTIGLLRGPEETFDEHRKIIKAIRERDTELARQEMIEHIDNTKNLLYETLNRIEELGIDSRTLKVNELKIK